MSDEEQHEDYRLPEESELFAVVVDMLGHGRITVRCSDGETRMARIPGRMRKRNWIRQDDIVLVEPWDWQDEKADVTWRYDQQDATKLRENGYLDGVE